MGRSRRNSWWSRRAGGRDVFRLALPLVVSTTAWSLMHFVDRMFLLWYSQAAMAAAMPAGTLHFSLLCLPMGIAAYVNTFVAQYHGAGRPTRIGLAVGQGVWIGLASVPLFLAVIPLAPVIFEGARHAPQIVALEITYFQILTVGAGGVVTATALSAFFTGRGETRVVMIVDVAISLLNIVLDYAWIFGRFGFPEMGIAGAAWATVVSQWTAVLLYALFMLRPKYRDDYGLAGCLRPNLALLRRLLRFGGPNGVQMLLEVAAFTLFILLVGRLGEDAMAATTLAFNVNSVAFIPMLGLSLAVSTMVGQQLGRNRPRLAARATWTALWLALAYMGTMALLYLFAPDLFLMGHAAGTPPEEFDRLRDLTVVLLRFVAAYCLFDALNIVFVGAIKGAGDTRFILWTNLIIAPLPVAAGWWGTTRAGLGLGWCWVVITTWVCTLGLIYLTRFLQGHWRTMRVIEPELDEPPTDAPLEAVMSGAVEEAVEA